MRATHKEPLTCPFDVKGEQSRRNPAKPPMPSASQLQAGTAIDGDHKTLAEPRDIICSFDSLYNAMLHCQKNVMWKDSTAGFVANHLINLVKLQDGLDSGKYGIDGYTTFHVYEPKKRKIVSTRIKDRVFQRSLCDNYLYHEITKHFIYDNCACQKNRGTDFAMGRLKRHIEHYYRRYGIDGWVYKFDLHDFFGKTTHAVATAAIRKRVADQWVFEHAKAIVDSFSQGENPKVGMGLGSEVTQLVELCVIDDLDHYIKEVLKVRYYVRYMDDFILMHPSKEHLQNCRRLIEERLAGIDLSLSRKKTQLFPVTQPIRFLGFSYQLTGTGKVVMRILPENVKKQRRKLRKLVGRAKEGRMAKEDVHECYKGWRAHASRGNTRIEIIKMDAYYKSLWRDYYVQTQKHKGSTP